MNGRLGSSKRKFQEGRMERTETGKQGKGGGIKKGEVRNRSWKWPFHCLSVSFYLALIPFYNFFCFILFFLCLKNNKTYIDSQGRRNREVWGRMGATAFCAGLWKEVLAWQKESIEQEARRPGRAAVAPGWLRKLSSSVWQTFTAGPAAAAGSSQQIYLGIKTKGRRGGEGKKQGAAYF